MRLVLFILLLAGALGAHAADMYRSIAPDGTVVFSDRPQGKDSEVITVASAARTRTALEAPSEPAPARDTETTSGAATSAAELTEQIAKNCELARDNLDSLMISDRLYRVLENGERDFLSEEEITQARTQARAQVAQWCN
jgi:transcription initiation factor TFIID subunit TAF12